MRSSSTDNVYLRQIQYWVEWLSAGFSTGKWNSLFLGRGYDFHGITPFENDPDIVRINWPATITSDDEVQVNQFREEREINVYLLSNLGPSMAFGSQVSKLERL